MKQHTLQPKLRFAKFSGDWGKYFIKNISEFIGGGTPDTSNENFWKGNIPWISSSDIIDNEIHKVKISRYINNDSINNSATKLIPEGSLLIVSRVGVGKFAIAPQDLCTSQDFTNLIVNKEVVYSFFLAYELFAKKNLLLKISQGTSIKGFTSSDLKSLRVILPQLPEQQKIADYLTTIDVKINLLEEKKTELSRYKKAMMQKLFSQEIRFKDENENDYPEWEEKRLGKISTIKTGISNRQDSNLNSQYTFFDRSQEIRKSSRYLFDSEAIIVAGEGSEFIPKYFIGKFDLHQRTYAIMDYKKCLGLFLFHYINFKRKYFESQAVGSTVKSLRLPMFEKMPIKMPVLSEQQKIADFLSAIDESISKVEEQIKETQSFKKAMLQQMFV